MKRVEGSRLGNWTPTRCMESRATFFAELTVVGLEEGKGVLIHHERIGPKLQQVQDLLFGLGTPLLHVFAGEGPEDGALATTLAILGRQVPFLAAARATP